MKVVFTMWNDPDRWGSDRKIHNIGQEVFSFAMGAHNGTHVDAPFHFLHSGKTAEQTAPLAGPI